MNKLSAWFSLFTSSGTLICCALPSLLVSLGMGATMAGLVAAVPQLVWLSQHKTWIFVISGLMIFLAGFMQYRARFEPCPTDPVLAKACDRSRRWSTIIFALSVGCWLVGAFFAFVAPYLMD